MCVEEAVEQELLPQQQQRRKSPVRKMHHYIRAPDQSPHHEDQPENLSAEVLPSARLQHLFFTCLPLLPMSLSATFGEAGHSKSNCHLVGLLSGLHTLRLLYSNR